MLEMSKLVVIVACSSMALAGPVIAQDYSMSPIQFPSAFNTNAMAQIGKVYGQNSLQRTAKTRSLTAFRPATLAYSPVQSRRRANLAAFVEKSRKVDPRGAAQMQALFASTDPIAALGRDLTRYGLRTDNVADAYAVYWVQAWQAANGDTSDPSRAAMQAVKAQAANAIATTPEFATATEATKQEFAEAMMVQAMITSASVDTYKGDAGMMRKVGDAVRKGARASGLDLDAMTLTEEGFVPVRKTGAIDPTPDQQQASATPAPAAPATDKSPPYALMAAAGGAGLGGVFLLGKMMGRKG